MARGRRAAPTTPSNRLEEPTQQWKDGFELEPLQPPYDQKTLLDIVEATGALSACIDSLTTNTDLRGHTYKTTIDLSASDIDEQVQAALDFRDGTLGDDRELVDDIAAAIGETKTGVEQEKRRIATQIRRERFVLQAFFSSFNPKETFTRVREKTRRDLEATGNAYWELIRGKTGRYQQGNWIPAHTMHMCRTIMEPVIVSETVMISPVQFIQRSNYVHYRRFIQGYGNRCPIYFKEAGDPRVMSNMSGKIFGSVEELQAAEGERGAVPATEILHFAIHSPTSTYGIPRWIGELVNIYGVKSADVVNNDYFNKKTLPPYIVKIMGGRMDGSDKEAFAQNLEDALTGRANYHKPLILEVQTSNMAMQGMAAPPSVDIQPLTKGTPTDGQFLNYSQACTDRIGAAFRLPRLVRGDSRDMTRATANATLKFAEQQVFLPLRQSFDDVVTKVIFPNLGVFYHRFESRGPELTDPVELIQMLHKSSQGAYILPDEARNLAEQAYGVPFREVDEGWAAKPSVLVQAGLVAKTHDMNGNPVPVPEATEEAPADPQAASSPSAAPPKKSAESTGITKAWVHSQIEDRVDEGIDELTGDKLGELVNALSPYFKEK